MMPQKHRPSEVQMIDREKSVEPWLEITEQPKERGYRFRYEVEGGSHGNIHGALSTRNKKYFPTVKLHNYSGAAKICVSLVTDEPSPRPHIHKLIGKDCKDGNYVVEVKPGSMVISFSGLAIQHSTRKGANEIITERILQDLKESKYSQYVRDHNRQNLDYFNSITLDETEREEAQKDAEEITKNMKLSSVRLCFKATLRNERGDYCLTLPEVISNPIFDAKAPGAAALKICRMDKSSGCCIGDEEVFLLCDKVQKEDITVCFQELDDRKSVKWEAYASFGPQDVHRQFAIVFRTPAYLDRAISGPVLVYVKLKRIYNQEESNCVPFTYYPEQQDLDQIGRKRRKPLPNFGTGTQQFPPGDNDSSLGSGGRNSAKFPNTGGFSGSLGGVGAGGNQNQQMRPTLSAAMPSQPVSARPMLPTTVDFFNPSQQQQHFLPPAHTGANPSLQDMPFYNTIPRLTSRGTDYQDTPTDLRTKIHTDSSSRCDSDTGYMSSEGSLLQHITPGLFAAQTHPRTSHPFPDHREVLVTSPDTDKHPSLVVRESTLAQLVNFGERLYKALQDFAKTGDVGYLLLVQRHLVVEQDHNGDNIIHLAVLYKKIDVLKNLVKVLNTLPECTALNQTNLLCQTPLHMATLLRDAQTVELLVNNQASISIIDRHGNNPIHLAVKSRAPCCLKILIEANRPKQPSYTNRLAEVNQLNYDGLAPLHLAVQEKNLECLKILLQLGGANVNIQAGKTGNTAIHYAIELDQLAILGYLANEVKAEVNIPNFYGATPLHSSVELQSVGCTAVLMSAGADPDLEMYESVASEVELVESEGEEKLSLKERKNEREERKEKQRELGEDLGSEEEEEEEKEEQGQEEQEEDNNLVTPRMLAAGHKQLEQILNGEECTERRPVFHDLNLISHSRHMDPQTFQAVAKTEQQLRTGQILVPPSVVGDLCDLDSMARVHLCRLLDPEGSPGKDWRALAAKLELEAEDIADLDSPTRAILDQYEALEGTLTGLREALTEIQRLDAVTVVQEVEDMKKRAQAAGTERRNTSFVGQLQSSMASLNLKS